MKPLGNFPTQWVNPDSFFIDLLQYRFWMKTQPGLQLGEPPKWVISSSSSFRLSSRGAISTQKGVLLYVAVGLYRPPIPTIKPTVSCQAGFGI